MRFQLGPRDQRNAARTAAWIYLVSAVVIMASNLLLPMSDNAMVSSVVITLPLLLCGGLLSWPGFPYAAALLLVTPVFGVIVAVALDLATSDASAGAQVGFCLPVLFAASQLRVLGATVAVVAAIAGDILVVWQLRPNLGGVLDVVNLALVLLLMTGLLVQAGRRHDRLVARLQGQASLDPLTGLVTRRVLDAAVQRALDSSAVHAGTALLLVDVDHFKSINDTHGHPVGDDALVHLATVLGGYARPDSVISRLGGDEVAVLLPNCSEAVARERAHEFLRAMQQNPFPLRGGGALTISISLGVAHAASGQSRLRELYAAADASLYEAKRNGRGRVGRSGHGYPEFIGPPGPGGVGSIGSGSIGSGGSGSGGSEGVADGLLEVGDMTDGVLQGGFGLPGDDRIDHR